MNEINEKFRLSCESTVDLPYSYVSDRNISVLFYSYMIDGVEYPDDMGRDESARADFYEKIKEGKKPTTSQINTYRYLEYFRPLLEKGDVLHVAFGSGMTPSVNNAIEAAKTLQEEFPDRRLIIVDSTCSSSGYGMLVDIAADLRDCGEEMEAVAEWLLNIRKKIHHNFFVTDLTMLRRGGRVSGPTAAIATVLGICPTLQLNETGHIVASGKVRGKQNAIKATVQAMVDHLDGDLNYSGKCYVSHANAIKDAEVTKAAVETTFPNLKGKVQIFDIGTIIASHCGPGTVALFYIGDERV
ncbi:MAG: DegV family protein [Eubacteriales bacterium]